MFTTTFRTAIVLLSAILLGRLVYLTLNEVDTTLHATLHALLG
jgi:hypothetical protein